MTRRRRRLAFALSIICCVAVFAYGNSLYRARQLERKNVLKPTAMDVNDMKEVNYEPFRSYLAGNGKPPIEYVVDKFKIHDVILLGETHEIRENCEFVSALVGSRARASGLDSLNILGCRQRPSKQY